MTIDSNSSWTFKITEIEETITPSVFHPHSPSWTAPPAPSLCRGHVQVRQCLLLGSVEIRVKAIPPSGSNKRLSPMTADVRLDLGYHQYFYIELKASTEGRMILKWGV